MGCWEFLLQQENDNSWIGIPAAVVEIAEGNYKMVGKGDRPNSSVEVRLSYQSRENPSLARSRRRLRQTNAEGLVVILPPTNLTPGVWRLACYDPLNSNLLSALELQVLPAASSEIRNFELPVGTQFQLILDHHTFVRTNADRLTVSGTIESNLDLEGVLPLILSYELSDPQTAQILYQYEQKLFPEGFPFSFTSHLQLGKDSASYLFLGEAILSTGTTILVRQPFSITADASQMLEAVRLPEFSQLLTKGKPTSSPTLLQVKPCEPIEEFPLSSGQVLPPKITRTHQLKNPKLPKLPPLDQSEIIDSEPQRSENSASEELEPILAIQTKPDPEETLLKNTADKDNSAEQSLNLLKTESRFWSHLNSLVTESK
jgi:hypothetical protein